MVAHSKARPEEFHPSETADPGVPWSYGGQGGFHGELILDGFHCE